MSSMVKTKENIRTTAELEKACARAREAGVLALDTEFVWTRTYHPQLGIVQLGVDEEQCWALDCMSVLDTTALKTVIEDASVVKILHDPRQDLVLLHSYCGALPRNIFDTQLAAAFAGMPFGMGLQKLLLAAIDIGLPKTETCTDWLQRPLSEMQIRYALDDVRYLPKLRTELLRRLTELGNDAYLADELPSYENKVLYDELHPEEMWRRIKLRRTCLSRRGLAILRAVAATRERLARKWNLPRNWLGDDGSLMVMAERGEVGRLVHRLRGGQGDTLRVFYVKAIKSVEQLTEEEYPEDPNRYYISEVKTAAEAAMAWLEEKAVSLQIAQPAIANRATVTAFVDDAGDESNPLATGWRYELVGREMSEKFAVE